MIFPERITVEANTSSPIDFSANQHELTIHPLDNYADNDDLQLYVLGVSGDHLLPISKGENGGKKLPYYNPVEYAANLGEWDTGKIQHHRIKKHSVTINEWIVIAQSKSSRSTAKSVHNPSSSRLQRCMNVKTTRLNPPQTKPYLTTGRGSPLI